MLMTDASKLASLTALSALLLGGCGSIGQKFADPKLSPISNPATVTNAEKVSMPLPAPKNEPAGANSLWRSGGRSFFGDQRASKIGDILTVNISIADSAQVADSTATSHSGS